MIDEIDEPTPMTIGDATPEAAEADNAAHLSEWVGDLWFDVLAEADRQLTALDPAYRIEQIKEKFGGLRYYYDSNLDFDDPVRQQMEDVITNAERAIAELERRRRTTG